MWAWARPPEWCADGPEKFHGPHVPVRRAGCAGIAWRRVHPPLERVRVVAHTCECRATVFELCGRGGAYLIRRTTRGPGGPVVEESAALPAKAAEDLWFRLLRGLAR